MKNKNRNINDDEIIKIYQTPYSWVWVCPDCGNLNPGENNLCTCVDITLSLSNVVKHLDCST